MGGRIRLPTRVLERGTDLSGYFALGASGVACMASVLKEARAAEMRSFTNMTERQLKASLRLEINTKHSHPYRANLAKRKLRELLEMVDASRIAYETRIIDAEGEPLDPRADAIRAALQRSDGKWRSAEFTPGRSYSRGQDPTQQEIKNGEEEQAPGRISRGGPAG